MSLVLRRRSVAQGFVFISLLLLLIYAIGPVILTGLSTLSTSDYAIPSDWENHLDQVISYVNDNIKDNYTIITTYALPVSYFTDHPVIELLSYDGMMSVVALNDSVSTNPVELLTNHSIYYMLLPTAQNSKYSEFQVLAKQIQLLNISYVSRSPGVALLKRFSDFDLYRLIPASQLSSFFAYLTQFQDGWSAINNLTILGTSTFGGESVQASGSLVLPLADDNQTSFWKAALAQTTDSIQIGDSSQVRESGNNSLEILLNGTGNMVIEHDFPEAVNFSLYDSVGFDFYGANTSKSVELTFHTVTWQDYYSAVIRDNFSGWRSFIIPKDSFSSTGNPSWSSIVHIEILMGNRTAVYYLDRFQMEGSTVGIDKILHLPVANSSQTEFAIYVQDSPAGSSPGLELTYANNTSITYQLALGLNTITIPAVVPADVQVRIYFDSSTEGQALLINYLGIYLDF